MSAGNRSWNVTRLRAPNDVNGNPRRLLVGRWHGDERIVDEGYNGDGPLFIARAFGPNAKYDGTTYDVRPGVYREMVKRAGHY